MRSAPCALAPSHPYHVMPSRITRNSHRPRASDRTMVACEHQFACRSLKLDGIVTISRETHEDGQHANLLQRSETTVGWISRNNLHSDRGGALSPSAPLPERNRIFALNTKCLSKIGGCKSAYDLLPISELREPQAKTARD